MTSGGVVLPESAKEKPSSGIVVRTGPGKRKEDGELEPPKVDIPSVSSINDFPILR